MRALIPLLPGLGACHLFSKLEIDCTVENPCVVESGAETGVAPRVPSTAFMWVMQDASGGVRVQEYTLRDGAHVRAREWTGLEDVLGSLGDAGDEHAGAVAWHEGGQKGVAFGPDGAVMFLGDGGVEAPEFTPGARVSDVELGDGWAWAATPAGVYAFDYERFTPASVFTATAAEVPSLASAGQELWFSALTEGEGADLWHTTANAEATTLVRGFDDNGGRAAITFLGPEGKPLTCSTAGAVYDPTSLAEGSTTPLAYAEVSPPDVHDCAWDEGAGAFYVLSATQGMIAVDPAGEPPVVIVPPVAGSVVFRATFFTPGA